MKENVCNCLCDIATTLLEPITYLPNNIKVKCSASKGPQSFFDLYNKIVSNEYKIRRSCDFQAILKLSRHFELAKYDISKNILNVDEICKIDPNFFEGTSFTKKSFKFCTLNFRNLTLEQLNVNLMHLACQYNCLHSFDGISNSVEKIAADIFGYIQIFHKIWASSYFLDKIPSKIFSQNQSEVGNTFRKRINLKFDNINLANQCDYINNVSDSLTNTENYGVFNPFIYDRIRVRTIPRNFFQTNKIFSLIQSLDNYDDCIEFCIFLQKCIDCHSKTKKGSSFSKITELFYKDKCCKFSKSHHPSLLNFSVYFKKTGKCVACELLQPLSINDINSFPKELLIFECNLFQLIENEKRFAIVPNSITNQSEIQKISLDKKKKTILKGSLDFNSKWKGNDYEYISVFNFIPGENEKRIEDQEKDLNKKATFYLGVYDDGTLKAIKHN